MYWKSATNLLINSDCRMSLLNSVQFGSVHWRLIMGWEKFSTFSQMWQKTGTG